MIKNAMLWETVGNKIRFTKANTSNALGKDSCQSCLWTRS